MEQVDDGVDEGRGVVGHGPGLRRVGHGDVLGPSGGEGHNAHLAHAVAEGAGGGAGVHPAEVVGHGVVLGRLELGHGEENLLDGLGVVLGEHLAVSLGKCLVLHVMLVAGKAAH